MTLSFTGIVQSVVVSEHTPILLVHPVRHVVVPSKDANGAVTGLHVAVANTDANGVVTLDSNGAPVLIAEPVLDANGVVVAPVAQVDHANTSWRANTAVVDDAVVANTTGWADPIDYPVTKRDKHKHDAAADLAATSVSAEPVTYDANGAAVNNPRHAVIVVKLRQDRDNHQYHGSVTYECDVPSGIGLPSVGDTVQVQLST